MFASLDTGVIQLITYDIDRTFEIEEVKGWIDHAHRQAYYQIGDELLMSRYEYRGGLYDVTPYDRVQLLTSTSVITEDEFIALFCKLEKMSLHTFLREHYDRKLDYNLQLETFI